MPIIVSSMKTPVKYGSGENPWDIVSDLEVCKCQGLRQTTYLPIATSIARTAQWTCNWTESNVRSFALVLGTKLVTSLLCQTSIPGSSNGQASWEDGGIGSLTDSQGAVLETETGEVQAGDGSDLYQRQYQKDIVTQCSNARFQRKVPRYQSPTMTSRRGSTEQPKTLPSRERPPILCQ